ncbi:hypothetical protein AB0H83_44590 [Dactylosporangium sp. NPDC050688]|uniref:glycosyl hydrolase 2 galactose-binding domain-containing protein n=1 Tax=Dactylosporangium sp. NPDC050688 TaxID=3157217 RepID=UPI0033E0539D
MVTSHVPLPDGSTTSPLTRWHLLATAPDELADPTQLPRDGWLPAPAPGTVTHAARTWPEPARTRMAGLLADPDEHDWWFRCTLPPTTRTGTALLRFHGLASVADIWVGARHVHRTDNMFRAYDVPLDEHPPTAPADVVICFRSLAALLRRRLPRPAWTTRLVTQQQLRWHRTTLLGRMPGWSPGPPPVGPWRPVELVQHSTVDVATPRLTCRLEDGDGIVEFQAAVRPLGGHRLTGAHLHVGDHRGTLRIEDGRIAGEVRVPDARRWSPHTHGEQPRYPAEVELVLDARTSRWPLPAVGFRSVTLTGAGGTFPIAHNDTDVFFRGGCWTPLDPARLAASPQEHRDALRALRDAGGNMVRVCGPLTYESDAFYDACDELGIAVWHDFMFANMDYPVHDPAFRASIRAEAVQVLTALAPHPCVTVLCGGSEVAQQATFAGAGPDGRINAWFAEELRDLCAAHLPGVPYWPSSPSGGALPVHVGAGDAHYYGVGAYLRDLSDVRVSRVRFASECLAFANIPEPRSMQRFFGPRTPAVHDPRWKAGSPRDSGAGWDFDDVRDEYLRRLFRVDPLQVRYRDPDRYAALGRVTTGELMARVFALWRAPADPCGGALVWFWRDIVPGAGWGVVDADGVPKAAYHYLRRAWRPTAVHLEDRGLDGLWVVAVHERREPVDATVRVALYPDGGTASSAVERRVRLAADTPFEHSVDALFGAFRDLTAAYGFGPPPVQAVLAELVGPDGEVLAEDCYLPGGPPADRRNDLGLTVTTSIDTGDGDDNGDGDGDGDGSGTMVLHVAAERLAYALHIDVAGFAPDDNYYTVLPGRRRSIRLRRTGGRAGTVGRVEALNADGPVSFALTAADA